MIVKLPWKPGPAAGAATLAAVTRSDFARYRDMPAAFVAALRLRRAIAHTPGAAGLSLGVELTLRRRTWSRSEWESADALRAFLRSPAHVAVVRRFRGRVAITSETWPLAEGVATRTPRRR